MEDQHQFEWKRSVSHLHGHRDDHGDRQQSKCLPFYVLRRGSMRKMFHRDPVHGAARRLSPVPCRHLGLQRRGGGRQHQGEGAPGMRERYVQPRWVLRPRSLRRRQDQAAARVWYQKSAEKGERRAAHNLACSYRDGEGGPVDRALAAKYFRMAAEAGHHEAATNLGIAYGRGLGVERDLEEARRWLTQGAEAGDELAVQELRALDQGGGTMEDMMSLFMAQGSMRFSCN